MINPRAATKTGPRLLRSGGSLTLAWRSCPPTFTAGKDGLPFRMTRRIVNRAVCGTLTRHCASKDCIIKK